LKFDGGLEIQENSCCPFLMESKGSGNVHAAPI